MVLLRFASGSAVLLACACGSSPTGQPEAGTGDGGQRETGPDVSAKDGAPNDGATNDAADASTADAATDSPTLTPLCTVAASGTSGVVLAGRLLLPAGPSMGEVFFDSKGKIACAAASCSATAGYAAATRIACPGGVISPALINAHDHTEYATLAPESHGTIRYEHRHDWLQGADGATPLPRVYSTKDDATIAGQELRFVLGGATSILGSGGVHGLVRNLGAYFDYSELEGLAGAPAFFDTFPLGDSGNFILSSGCAYPSIDTTTQAFAYGAFAPHIGEGIILGAENELTCASASANDLITSQTSIIHGVGFNANDVAVVQTAGAKLIWSPRSNISLYGDTAPVTEYRTAGVTIALGTDWLPSGSMNVLRELACADAFNQKYLSSTFSDKDLWAMSTINAAVAAGFDSQIGSLAVGKLADITVFDGRVNADYRAVLAAGVEDVHLVLRGGKVLYGDTPIVTALAKTCEALSVCGEDRSVCFDVPGVTLGAVRSRSTSIYPLFFCKTDTPSAEPSCVPYRDTYPAGISATDRDGDGVPDGADDCPDTFNPPRPMDGTSQADVDGDGFGDVCDAQPLDAAAH